MKRSICLIVALAFFISTVPAFAGDIDLTMPDALTDGIQVAKAQPQEFTDHLVKWPEFNERIAAERDKTNDTIAIVAAVVTVMLLHHFSNIRGRDGKDGEDGQDGTCPDCPPPPCR